MARIREYLITTELNVKSKTSTSDNNTDIEFHRLTY